MGPKRIAHHAQLTATDHNRILNELRDVIKQIKETRSASPELRAIDLRDWWFVFEDGTSIVRLFLSGPKSAAVTLDDCMFFHEGLMESDVFDNFGDDVSIEVGSLGVEAPLRQLEDFEEHIGERIDVETWVKLDGRGRFPMTLVRVEPGQIVMSEGKQEFVVPLEQVRTAFVPYSPLQPRGKKQSKKR